jgi:hypothetical protein
MEIIEAPVTVLKHSYSPLIQNYMKTWQGFFSLPGVSSVVRSPSTPTLWQEITTLVHITDLIGITLALALYKPFLQYLYKTLHKDVNKLLIQPTNTSIAEGSDKETDNYQDIPSSYEKSFLGSMETPLTYFLWFPLFLYAIDIFSLFLGHYGFIFHIEGGRDFTRLLCTIAYSIITGSFLTKIKDWILHKLRVQSIQHQYGKKSKDVLRQLELNAEKDKLFDELSSFLIWVVVGFACLQAFSFEYGIALSK